MRTQAINVSDGLEHLLDVRCVLFGFSDVLEVFATGRQNVLIVVCSGRPRLGAWHEALREAGFETLRRPERILLPH